MHVDGNVGIRAAEVDGHARRGFFFGDGFHAMRNVLPAALEFALELRNHRVRMFTLQLIKHAARDHGDARCDQADGQQKRNDKIQK